MKNNQDGFGAVAIVFVLAAIGLVGLAGWYVWRQSSDAKSTNTAVETTDVADTQSQVEADPTSDWQIFVSEEGEFSLRYPSEWVVTSNIEYCEKDMILFGTTVDNAGKCQSDAPVLVAVARSSSGPEQWLDFSKAEQSGSYSDVAKTEITVDGVTGARVQGTYLGSDEEDSGLGPRPGAKIINYYFLKDGYTYYATYAQNPTDPDVADDFNLMVTKTLSFY